MNIHIVTYNMTNIHIVTYNMTNINHNILYTDQWRILNLIKWHNGPSKFEKAIFFLSKINLVQNTYFWDVEGNICFYCIFVSVFENKVTFSKVAEKLVGSWKVKY